LGLRTTFGARCFVFAALRDTADGIVLLREMPGAFDFARDTLYDFLLRLDFAEARLGAGFNSRPDLGLSAEPANSPPRRPRARAFCFFFAGGAASFEPLRPFGLTGGFFELSVAFRDADPGAAARPPRSIRLTGLLAVTASSPKIASTGSSPLRRLTRRLPSPESRLSDGRVDSSITTVYSPAGRL
jgi:hypothetical protein